MRRPDAARIWAWVALAAVVGVLVTLAVLLVNDVDALVLLLVALGLAGAGLWVAATRRGLARLLGFVVAIVALAGGAIVLVSHGLVVELIALAIAVAAFGAASRTALRRSRSAGKVGTALPVAKSTRARSAVLLINPKSGGGKAERFDLVREARRRGVGAVVLEPGDDLVELRWFEPHGLPGPSELAFSHYPEVLSAALGGDQHS